MPATDLLISPEEYLARERAADEKHEYRDGEIIPMGGASRHHVRIVTNVVRELSVQLYDRDCFVYSTDLRVRVTDSGSEEDLFTYPDVAVVCDEPQFLDDEFDTLLNPALLIEVFSKSTRDYDRGEKFARYRSIETLRDYVLIDQERPHAEHFSKQEDGRWMLDETSDPEATLTLSSVEGELALAEAYHKVEFEA
ncbi:MAG: hypothetical protein BRD38_00775 [Bacteroidetes bacterium QH_9_67_14]|nr:MAG: hypothetical protein BRD38_00775 [Bacteroidetes bacterium QH_9_67_14]